MSETHPQSGRKPDSIRRSCFGNIISHLGDKQVWRPQYKSLILSDEAFFFVCLFYLIILSPLFKADFTNFQLQALTFLD